MRNLRADEEAASHSKEVVGKPTCTSRAKPGPNNLSKHPELHAMQMTHIALFRHGSTAGKAKISWKLFHAKCSYSTALNLMT